jgi:signal transduction histidine kinase
MNLSPTSLAEAARSRPRWWVQLSDLNWPLVFLLYTVAGLISADTVFTATLVEGGGLAYYYPLIWEMTGFYAALALLPLVVLGFSRIPISRENWFWAVPVHLLLSVAFGAADTLMMVLSRQAAYDVFGLGRYHYGQMGYRLLMEYHKQFLHYWVVYAVLRALAYYRESRERERAAAALELKTSELRRQLSQAQLQALRSQLNPHFLFNTLNMISSVMYEDLDRADHMIAALSRMLRMCLDDNAGPQVPLRRELEFVNSAIELIRGRFQDQVETDLRCPPDLLDIPVPTMLIHTLLDNAIKHHHHPDSAPIRVSVQIERVGNTLHLHCLDNGPGIGDPDDAIGKGVGLANLRQRLRALHDGAFTFELSNRPEGGLHAHIAIPIHAEPERQLA